MILIFSDGYRFDFNPNHGADGRFVHSAGFAGPLMPKQVEARARDLIARG